MVKQKLTPAQVAKEEERKRLELLAYEQQLAAKREQKKHHALRILMLRDTCKILDGIYKDVTKIASTAEQQCLWSRYADGPNTPYGQRPTELRDYLYRWQRQLSAEQHDRFDWLLTVEERTVLDQSLYRGDRTERHVRAQQPDRMTPLRQRFVDTLLILDEIADVLSRPSHFHLADKTVDDLGTIRAEMQEQLRAHVDVLTWIISGNIDRDMVLLDECRAEFVHSSDVFSIGLYTNRDVPLARSDPLDTCKNPIEFHEMKVTVKCPRDMDFDGSVLRVVRYGFDHWSEYAPSASITFDDAAYIKRNLLESSRLEADMLERLERTTITRMKQERSDFELQLVRDENLSKDTGKKPKKTSKKSSKNKPVIEPPIVTEHTIVDMLPEFQQHEEEEHITRLATLQPDAALQLAPFELNQRQFAVLGGTYTVDYLERPAQSRKFSTLLFQRTHRQPDILLYHQYATEYAVVSPIASDSSIERDERVRRATHQWDNLIEITIQLPVNVSWWSQPTVVRWQNWEDSDEFRALSPAVQYYNLNHEAIEAAKLAKLFKRRQPKRSDVQPDYVLDLDLANRNASPESRLYYLMTKHIVPRLSQTYRFEAERRETEEKHAAILKQREHQRLEQMEDLKMRQQPAEPGSEDQLDDETLNNAVPVASKEIVRGVPARELFPVLGRQAPLVIIPRLFSQKPTMLLSELLRQIDEYNTAEMPRFKGKRKTDPFRQLSSSELDDDDEEAEDEKKRVLKPETVPKRRHQRRSDTLPLVPHCRGKWVTEGIHVLAYDETSRTITFKSTHIGTFGFAADKYYNLPLTEWEMKPNSDDIPMTVKIVLTGRVIPLELTVSPHGFRVHFVRSGKDPLPLLPADKWLTLAQLKHGLCSRNMSVFPDCDAMWYLPEHDADNDMPVSYKHEPMANHSYACMGYFCQTHQFRRSVWNRLSARREVLMSVRQVAENRRIKVESSAAIVLIRPESASFVRVEELCKSLAEQVQLAYHPEPPEQEFCCDLFDLLNRQSNDKSKKRQQNTDVLLRWNVIECLRAVQPFSYS